MGEDTKETRMQLWRGHDICDCVRTRAWGGVTMEHVSGI